MPKFISFVHEYYLSDGSHHKAELALNPDHIVSIFMDEEKKMIGVVIDDKEESLYTIPGYNSVADFCAQMGLPVSGTINVNFDKEDR